MNFENMDYVKTGKIKGFDWIEMSPDYICRTYEEMEYVYYVMAQYFFAAEETLRKAGYTDNEILLVETNARNNFKGIGKEN